jgi:O-antigen/teichoic acid export membrane protein
MLKSIKISLKETLVYGLGNIAVKIVGLILIPLYTNPEYFSIEDFGVLGILEISALVLTASLASALPQSLTRWFWDKEHKENQKGIFFMTLTTQIIVSLIFCILLITVSDKLSLLIFSTTNWTRVIILVILSSGIQSVNNIINTLMRLQSKSLLFTITNLIKLTTVLSLTIYFILSREMGLEGIYLAQVIGNCFAVVILLGFTIKNSKIYFEKVVFKSMNAYGFPLYLANLSAVLLTVIDRYSLNSMALLKSVALYTLAFKITSVLKLVIVDSIKMALGPMLLKQMDSPDVKRFYSKALLYSSYVLMIAIIGVSLFSYEIIKLISNSKEYWDAVIIIPVLSMSILFVNMKDVTIYGLHIAKKTRIIGLIVVFSTIMSLVFNILFIPLCGILGAAVATLLSQVIYWYACHYYSQKVFYVNYEIRKIASLVIIGALLSFSSLLLNDLDLLPRLLIKTVSILSFPFILYLFNFYEPVELQAINGFIRKWGSMKDLRKNLSSLKGINEEI